MTKKPIKKVYVDLLVIAIGFGVLAYLFKSSWLYIGSGVAILGAAHPFTARLVSTIWERIGKILGKINSTILLSIFFIVIICPISLFYRLRKKKENVYSNWQAIEKAVVDFEKPY